MKRRQYIIISVIVIILALIISAIVGNRGKTESAKEDKKQRITYVKTSSVQSMDHELVLTGHGRVNSSRDLILIAEVQGQLLNGNVSLKSGSRFKKGQILYQIDDKQAQLLMQARKSGFLTMIATAIPDLKMDYPESFEIWESFFEGLEVTQNLPELPEIKSVNEKTYLASRNILGEYYSIQADEEKLTKYIIVAPFDGSFVDVFAELGSVVNPGGQVARIIQTANLEVEVAMSVEEAGQVHLGDKVKVFSKGQGIVNEGVVLRLGRYVNPNTQSIDVFIGLDLAGADKIYDGMYVEIEIDAGQVNQVVKLPRKAIVDNDNVYTVVDSFLIKKKVEVQMIDESFTYVKGLSNGTDVVVEALSNPVDSMIVQRITQDE